jgi:hypothetical protein
LTGAVVAAMIDSGTAHNRHLECDDKRNATANAENVWNGRPISKIVLAEPLEVLDGTPVSLIELIPPVHQRVYRWASSTSASSSVRTSTTSPACIARP